MLVVVLAASSAALLLNRQDLALRQLAARADYEQALWILEGGLQWARAILAQDARTSRVDHGRELWASGLPLTEIREGRIAGEIRDQQGLFNLSNLVRDGKPSERDVGALRRLLAVRGVRSDLAEAIARWRVNAKTYPPLENLRQVPGCDPEVLARLMPVLASLPGRTAINVNLAPAEVLVAVIETLTLPEALALVGSRSIAPFSDVADFRRRLPRADLRVHDEELAVQSRYFLVRGQASVGIAEARLSALVDRTERGLPVVLWRNTS